MLHAFPKNIGVGLLDKHLKKQKLPQRTDGRMHSVVLQFLQPASIGGSPITPRKLGACTRRKQCLPWCPQMPSSMCRCFAR